MMLVDSLPLIPLGSRFLLCFLVLLDVAENHVRKHLFSMQSNVCGSLLLADTILSVRQLTAVYAVFNLSLFKQTSPSLIFVLPSSSHVNYMENRIAIKGKKRSYFDYELGFVQAPELL